VTQTARPGALRRTLDLFYNGCGVLAGIGLILMAALVVGQIVVRLANISLTWTAEFAGYAMAASSFLGLAYTFNSGGHIRVSMLHNSLPQAGQRWLDALCLLAGSAIVGYFAWHTAVLTWQSYAFNEMGPGSFAVPLWIPQVSMLVGILAMSVALIDNLFRLILTGTTAYQDAPSAT
jgi:TRAP-type C4-dicarboxylate transport system permease small subunit